MKDVDRFQELLGATQPPDRALIEDAHAAAARGGDSATPARLALVAMAALVLIAGATALGLPAVAASWLQHYAPQEVAELPPSFYDATYEPIDDRHIPMAQIEREVGFAPLVPAYLPPGCERGEHYVIPAPVNAAALSYSCPYQLPLAGGGTKLIHWDLTVTERIVEGEENPYVGKDSSQQLLINGAPATYSTGAWVELPGEERAVWIEDVAQELVFERDGVVARMSAGSTHVLPKAELIRMAESFQPYE